MERGEVRASDFALFGLCHAVGQRRLGGDANPEDFVEQSSHGDGISEPQRCNANGGEQRGEPDLISAFVHIGSLARPPKAARGLGTADASIRAGRHGR